jgi:hypothetical protein
MKCPQSLIFVDMHVTSQQGSCNYLDKHQSCQVQMIKNLDSFRIVPDHFQKKFFLDKINIGDLSPPRRQKIFGQCTILGVKKNFPELWITNIAQFFGEYCTTTFIWTTNRGLFCFFCFKLYKLVRIFFRKNRQYFRKLYFCENPWDFQDHPWDLDVSAKTWRLTGKPWDLAALQTLIILYSKLYTVCPSKYQEHSKPLKHLPINIWPATNTFIWLNPVVTSPKLPLMKIFQELSSLCLKSLKTISKQGQSTSRQHSLTEYQYRFQHWTVILYLKSLIKETIQKQVNQFQTISKQFQDKFQHIATYHTNIFNLCCLASGAAHCHGY